MKSTLLSVAASTAVTAFGIQASTAAVLASYATDNVFPIFASSGEIPESSASSLFTDNIDTAQMTDQGSSIQVRSDQFNAGDAPTTGASDRRFFWIIDAGAGNEIALENVQWRFGATTTNQYVERNYSIVYIATDLNFTNIIATSTVQTVGVAGNGGTVINNLTFTEDLGGSKYEKLYFGMGVNSFASNASGTKFLDFESITVNGTISEVPEPSSTALLGLGGLALVLRRRR